MLVIQLTNEVEIRANKGFLTSGTKQDTNVSISPAVGQVDAISSNGGTVIEASLLIVHDNDVDDDNDLEDVVFF